MTPKKIDITKLIPDTKNANKGTQRGTAMLKHSLSSLGAGRSVLVDKAGRIIAGNKTIQAAIEAGITDVIEVETTGDAIVAVKRIDIDLDSKKGHELAIADNRVGEVNLEWDAEALQCLIDEGVNMSGMFREEELGAILAIPPQGWEGEEEDPANIWDGMPEFQQDEIKPYHTIKVHFKGKDDIEAFAKLTGLSITEKTRYCWYPYREMAAIKTTSCKSES